MIGNPQKAAGVLLAALLLPGCAVNPSVRLADERPGAEALVLGGVPFHPQTEFQCGPAALATILGASGVAATPEALAPQVYLPGRQGSLQVELLAAARRAGRVPYVVDGELDAVWSQLDAGRPVLVLQNLWVRSLPKWHYAVVVGADPARNRIVLNSGDQRGLRMGAKAFMRTWDWAGRWAIVSLKPGEVPVGADVGRYLTAVADFEQVAGAEAAAPAYRAAVRAWPQDPRPHLALGNQAHARKDAAAALRHYRAGLALAPADPVLGNNLASVLGELGCATEARSALDTAKDALPAGSPWAAALEQTARELSAHTVPRSAACASLR